MEPLLTPKCILALDLGEKTGWAVLEHYGANVARVVESGLYKVTQPNDEGRAVSLNRFYNWLDDLILKYWCVQKLVWEHAQGRNPLYIAQHGELRAIAMMVALNNVDYDAIQVQAWKKQVVGKGNATKQDVRRVICHRFELDPKLEQDIIDAIAVGAAWIELHGGQDV